MRYFSVASVDSVIIYFGQKIEESIAKEVRQSYYTLKNAKLKHITQIVPSYASIMISYNFLKVSYKQICREIDEVLEHADEFYKERTSRLVTIPVYYGLEVGFDLRELARSKDRAIEEIVSLHVDKKYTVYAIGFSPGFAYMGEIDEALMASRLAAPRAKVPKGSVGIADRQTAIYPQLSPGGWQILGRTPLEMLDISYDSLSYLEIGDRVKFKSISKEEFLELGGEL